MKRLGARLIGAAMFMVSVGVSEAQTVDRLYILNCGEGIAGDISRWSPGVDEGKSQAFVDNCYLIPAAQTPDRFQST